MNISTKGLHVELSDSYVERFHEGLETMLAKYFGKADHAHLTLSKRQGDFLTEIDVHIGKELHFSASGMARNAYKSLDVALKAMAKQLRRNKRRLREDHPVKAELANDQVDRDDLDDEVAASDGPAPLVIAEKLTNLPRISVAEASVALEEGLEEYLCFVDKTTGKPAFLYRRSDGNHGWIEEAA